MSKKAWEKGNAAEALTPCYAAVDIGSNKIRLALYTLNAQGDVVEVDISEKRKFTCALAEGMTSDKGVIKEEKLVAAEKALKKIAALIKGSSGDPVGKF